MDQPKIERMLRLMKMMSGNTNYTIEELASKLVNLEINGFSGMATPMEAGSYLPGFDNFEATGFETCVNFMPMIGSIAYVGYIFELDENADVVRIMSIHKSKGLEFPIVFVAGLSKKFNKRW